MDPSIVKFFEEDEDESMHSGADVEAFQAALNRDIEGDASTSQPPDSDTAPIVMKIFQLGNSRMIFKVEQFCLKEAIEFLVSHLHNGQPWGKTETLTFNTQQPVQSAQQRSSEMEQKQQGLLVMGVYNSQMMFRKELIVYHHNKSNPRTIITRSS
ncbi:uncharacterized protein [Gossypium hirsutum]|uniref:Uncharacterized protein isoform X1 n=1 Tax=Gossypium hirsutum TaxID=3635 RepID=A0ABM3BGY1_GOSHI|nr:uncharacterized protein LOC121226494 isoform X1 [Gossypium hirsutum]